MAAVVEAAEVITLYVHYTPRETEGEPFKLKLKLKKTKTVQQMVAAFVKGVARSSRGYGMELDASSCYVNRINDDATYVRPETPVSAFANKEEIRIVRRDDVPEKWADPTNWKTPRATAFWIAGMKDDGGI